MCFLPLNYFSEEAQESGMDCDIKEEQTKMISKKEYDCVICNQTTPSSEVKPMGLVVLVQVNNLGQLVNIQCILFYFHFYFSQLA